MWGIVFSFILVYGIIFKRNNIKENIKRKLLGKV